MKNYKVWRIAFIALLIINIGGIVCFNFKSNTRDYEALKKKNINLQKELSKNSKELKYLLLILLENSDELKNYLPEYRDNTGNEFKEGLRRKIVKIELKIEQIEK
jgi:hypothetical protein